MSKLFQKKSIKIPMKSRKHLALSSCLNYCPALGILVLFFLLINAHGELQQSAFQIDFIKSSAVNGWRPTHDIAELKQHDQGLWIESNGTDPYSIGPTYLLPQDTPVWIEVRLKSSISGSFQVFYFGPHSGPTEEQSVRMNVPAEKWITIKAPAPDLNDANRLRLDPPSGPGITLIESIRIYPRLSYPEPDLEISGTSNLSILDSDVVEIRNSQTSMRLALNRWNTWNLNHNHLAMAESPSFYWMGYVMDGKPVWVQWTETEMRSRVTSTRLENGWRQIKKWEDPDGALWTFSRSIQASEDHDEWLDGEWKISVDADRQVLFLPMEFGFLGTRSFGSIKQQAIFPGLEYLGNEPSSSEKDLTGPEAERRIPDQLKITYPMQAIVADDAFVIFSWDTQPDLSAWFDSPDRWFGSDGHVMGAFFPGTKEQTRSPGSLVPYEPVQLQANKTLASAFRWKAGAGESVVDALKSYHQRFPFPDPDPERIDLLEYLQFAVAGWLDSEIREGALYRHANWMGRFQPGPAADVYFYLQWLADNLGKAGFDLEKAGNRNGETNIERLKSQAEKVAATIPQGKESQTYVSHIRTPAGALFLGNIQPNLEASRRRAKAILARINPDGTVLYSSSAPGSEKDYGKTHWTNHASGLSGLHLQQALELAIFSGDQDVIENVLDKLDQGIKTYKNAIPRGAQTWEVPLHTPDILASAHWVSACVDAYKYTHEVRYLEAARYWAWTGAPFVYQQISDEAVGPVGLYSSIPVFGATSWVAPVWIGLPVQWCGLVYAESLYRLAEVDPDSVEWKKMADGITLTGAEHTWTDSDDRRVGLLPDFFNLRMQLRDGPAINPGTLQAPMIRFLEDKSFYTWKRLNTEELDPIVVITTGNISQIQAGLETQESYTVQINPFLTSVPSRVIIHGDVQSINWTAEDQAGLNIHQIESLPPSTPGWVLTIQNQGILKINRDQP